MICPRCDDNRAGKIFEAPEDGSWKLYRCPRCYFVWRNTEEEEVTNPELYDPRFKLSEEKIAAMDPKPPIPPIKKANRRISKGRNAKSMEDPPSPKGYGGTSSA